MSLTIKFDFELPEAPLPLSAEQVASLSAADRKPATPYHLRALGHLGCNVETRRWLRGEAEAFIALAVEGTAKASTEAFMQALSLPKSTKSVRGVDTAAVEIIESAACRARKGENLAAMDMLESAFRRLACVAPGPKTRKGA